MSKALRRTDVMRKEGHEEAARILRLPIPDALFAATRLPDKTRVQRLAKQSLMRQLTRQLKKKTRAAAKQKENQSG